MRKFCTRVAFALLMMFVSAAQAETSFLPQSNVLSADPNTRRVGVAYSLWHYKKPWGPSWGHPLLGEYVSTQTEIMHKHAEWLAQARVDFILVDWSNNLDDDHRSGKGKPEHILIENATHSLFEQFASVPNAPLISLMIGFPNEPQAVTDGRLQHKADQVWDEYAGNPQWASKVEKYQGKPLLVVYVNTPSPYQNSLPPWNDKRFTVRYMTGFLSNQPNLHNAREQSKFGYWSWEDRGTPTYSIQNGHAEEMTVVAAWRGNTQQPSPGRQGGQTYTNEWQRAREVGPHYVIAGSFNEWKIGEQPSAEQSKDIEPSQEFGFLYMNILKQESTLFKQGK